MGALVPCPFSSPAERGSTPENAAQDFAAVLARYDYVTILIACECHGTLRAREVEEHKANHRVFDVDAVGDRIQEGSQIGIIGIPVIVPGDTPRSRAHGKSTARIGFGGSSVVSAVDKDEIHFASVRLRVEDARVFSEHADLLLLRCPMKVEFRGADMYASQFAVKIVLALYAGRQVECGHRSALREIQRKVERGRAKEGSKLEDVLCSDDTHSRYEHEGFKRCQAPGRASMRNRESCGSLADRRTEHGEELVGADMFHSEASIHGVLGQEER